MRDEKTERPEAYVTVAVSGPEGNAMLAQCYGARADPRLKGFGAWELLAELSARSDGYRSLTHIGDTTDTLSMHVEY